MKRAKAFLTAMAALVVFSSPAQAFFLDDLTFMNQMQQMMDRFTATTTNQMNSFTTTMTSVNQDYLNATQQLSTDVGTMADRIVYTEQLIGQMADRIVTTEAMLAQMTVLLAQIAAGQAVDPAIVTNLQNAIAGTCQDPTLP